MSPDMKEVCLSESSLGKKEIGPIIVIAKKMHTFLLHRRG